MLAGSFTSLQKTVATR